MSESGTSKDRRAQRTAQVGFILQFAFAATLFGVAIAYHSDVVLAAARWMVGGIIIWPILAIVFGQRHRTAAERLESVELRSRQESSGAQAIFDTEDEGYLIERRRLNWMLRYLVPGGAILLAAYHLLGNWVLWTWDLGTPLDAPSWREATRTGPPMVFCGAVGFLAFLFSRYAAGMSRMRGWRMLRSGASYLAGNALACLLVVAALGLQGTDLRHTEPLVADIIRIAMLVLGIEFVANFVLDFYRPRAAGVESRPAFDSRILALITEPGGIARSIAEAINYQFGFEVSGTWFYQLLKRALLPMLAFGLIALFLLSTVLIVDADEQVVVERFGRRLQAAPTAPLGPGLHFKAPWPIDKAYRARVDQIQQLTIGNVPAETDDDATGDPELKPILWGEKHAFNIEMMLVVASPELTDFRAGLNEAQQAALTSEGKAVGVGLLMVSVDIQYRIEDLQAYLYHYAEPEKLVEALAYRVLTDYAAGVDVDRFLGPGREQIGAALLDILQSSVDEVDLGIRVLFVGVQEAHPTDDVAKKFQEVVQAEREMESMVARAHALAQSLLTAVAGSRERAVILDEAIVDQERLAKQETPDSAALVTAAARVDDLLFGTPDGRIRPTGGAAAQALDNARKKTTAEMAQAERSLALFGAEVVAYESSPQLYKTRKYLAMLESSLELIRKYVIVAGPSKKVIIVYDQEDKGVIDLGSAPG